jgi:hypothetical protein
MNNKNAFINCDITREREKEKRVFTTQIETNK